MGPGDNWGRESRSKFLDANGDGIFDLLYFPFAASPQYQLPEPWQIHLGTTSSLGDFDNSSIVISNRGKGSLIATWAGDDLIKDTNPSLQPTTIDAGMGRDTVQYGGARDAYVLAQTTDGTWTVKNNVLTDLLVDVERLKFADVNVALDINGNAGQAYRLYQAAFNRTPDIGGLGYHMNALDTGLALSQVAQNFINSPEFSATYGALNTSQFVTQLYANVLHRAPDSGGLAYHVARLDSGVARADVLVGFSESPENQVALIGAIQNGMVYTY